MIKLMLAAVIAVAGIATTASTPATAKYFLHKKKNSTQTVKRGGRGGAHHGQRYGRTSP